LITDPGKIKGRVISILGIAKILNREEMAGLKQQFIQFARKAA
jgi:hypothetical protein